MQKKRSIGYIKKLGDNKYLLRLSLGFDDFGKRLQPSKTVAASSDREAERLLYEFYNEREKLKVQHASLVPETLGELYAEWMNNHVKKSLKRQTILWYTQLWDNHVIHASRLKLSVLAPTHIYKIVDGVNGARTKNAVFKMLKAICNKGVKWGYITTNPCNRVDTPKYSAPEQSVLSPDEIKTVYDAIKYEPLKYQAIFYFAVICSLRRESIIGFKWSDIDFKNNQLKVKFAAIYIPGEGVVADEPKTEKSKVTLHLPDILKETLIKLNNEQLREKKKWGDKWVDEGWIFTQQNGKVMYPSTATHWWKKFAKKYDIKDVPLHGLRHTAATYMIKNNVPISTVSGVLGHAKISTTVNTYAHVIEDTKEAAINVMESVITGSETTPTKTSEAI